MFRPAPRLRSLSRRVTAGTVVVTGRLLRTLPGVAGAGCIVASVALLASPAWALLPAGGFLLAADWRLSK